MVGVLVSFVFAAQTVGALTPAIDYCISKQLPADTHAKRFPHDAAEVPDLVRNFIAVPRRFVNDKAVGILRFEGGDGAVAWAVDPGPHLSDCEIMLTGAPNHLDERDRTISSFDPTFSTASLPSAETPLWRYAFAAQSMSGKRGYVQMRGTGSQNTNRDEIQIDVTTLVAAN